VPAARAALPLFFDCRVVHSPSDPFSLINLVRLRPALPVLSRLLFFFPIIREGIVGPKKVDFFLLKSVISNFLSLP